MLTQALTRQYVDLQTWCWMMMQRGRTNEKGQDFLEYIIIVGFALLVVTAVAALYAAIEGKFQQAASAVGGIGF